MVWWKEGSFSCQVNPGRMAVKYTKRILMLSCLVLFFIFLIANFTCQTSVTERCLYQIQHKNVVTNGVQENNIVTNRSERQTSIVKQTNSGINRRKDAKGIGVDIRSTVAVKKVLVNDECVRKPHNYLVKTPKGDFIPKFNKNIQARSFGELIEDCNYVNDKIECSDVRYHGETMFRQSQLTLIRLLKIMDLICTKHSINYWVMWGTLLGAYRHKGNIPWDSDADIGMLDTDYDQFQKIVRAELPVNIYFQDGSGEPEFAMWKTNEAKIRDNSSCYGWCLREGCRFNDGLQVDIFVFHKNATSKKPTMLVAKRGRDKVKYNFVFPTSRIMMDDIELSSPAQPENFLKVFYGKTFMTPVKYKCPPLNYIPVPWYSCNHINSLPTPQRKKIWTDVIVK